MNRMTLGLLVVSSAISVLLSSCSGSSQGNAGALPTLTTGCAVVSTTLPAVPLIETHSGGDTSVFAPVCVDGHGPYPFVLDTGAAASLVDTQLVDLLHLPATSPAPQVVGLGCTATEEQVSISSWSVGGIPLAGQAMLTAKIPGFGLNEAPAGVLGGDVLSRFGAVRIDFRAKKLVVLSPEAAVSSGATIVRGEGSEPPPQTLVDGTPKASVDLTVVKFDGTALATAPIAFGASGLALHAFVIDTGASESSIVAPLATSLGLKPEGRTALSTDVGCPRTVDEVSSGPWLASLSVRLASRPLARPPLAGGTQQGVMGALGCDVLSSYGSIVLDYRNGVLWLGAGQAAS